MTQVVILAGGLGTRLREETAVRPKPMVEIGDRPILWHIMKIFDHYGHRSFVVPVGYKGHLIKEFFLGYRDRYADFRIELGSGAVTHYSPSPEAWTVSVLETGTDTQTGGRLKRLAPYLDERFFLTYGDGVANVDLAALEAFHHAHGRLATVTAVHPSARFGAITLDRDRVTSFAEKAQADAGWINGGFFLFDRSILEYLEDDDTSLERDALERVVADDQLRAFRHDGFWEPMDTQRDLDHLNEQWSSGRAPWKVWQ